MLFREKEEELAKVRQAQEQQALHSERALETFKAEVQRSSARVYDDMKRQMEKIEADLDRSKQLREKQAKEFERMLTEERRKHQQEVNP